MVVTFACCPGLHPVRFAATEIFPKLKSAAAQMGALRLASACESVERHLLSHPERAPHLDADLRLLVGTEMAEIIRVQRRLRTLLFS